MCQLRYESVRRWKRPYQGTRKQNRFSNENVNEKKPSTNKRPDGDTKVSMVRVEDQTALHTPVWINDVKFPRCPIDTGAEVNLISVEDVIKYGFSCNLGGIQRIKGFNGGPSPVDGVVQCDIRLGPCGNPKKVELLVTSANTIPIIGCPALAELDIQMDCQERILFDDEGDVVICSAINRLKN